MQVRFRHDVAIVNGIKTQLTINPTSIAAIGSSRDLPSPNPGSDLDLVVVVPSLLDVEIARDRAASKYGIIHDEQGSRFEYKFFATDIPIDVTVLDPGGTRLDGDPTRDRYELFLGLIRSARTLDGAPLRESLHYDEHVRHWESRRIERIQAVEGKLALTARKVARRDDWFTIMELQDLLFTSLCLERHVFPSCSVKHATIVFPDFYEVRDRMLRECGLRLRVDRLGPSESELA